jgi:hypothetical protein
MTAADISSIAYGKDVSLKVFASSVPDLPKWGI